MRLQKYPRTGLDLLFSNRSELVVPVGAGSTLSATSGYGVYSVCISILACTSMIDNASHVSKQSIRCDDAGEKGSKYTFSTRSKYRPESNNVSASPVLLNYRNAEE